MMESLFTGISKFIKSSMGLDFLHFHIRLIKYVTQCVLQAFQDFSSLHPLTGPFFLHQFLLFRNLGPVNLGSDFRDRKELGATVLNVTLCLTLVGPLGHVGLALANSIASESDTAPA